MSALALIRLLRPFAFGRFSAHLSECALYEIVDRGFNPWLPPLGKKHVLGLRHLSDRTCLPVFVHPSPKRIV